MFPPQRMPIEGRGMRFRMLLSKGSFISSRDPYWAHRPQALWPLQVQVPWFCLILLGVVSPVFPVQHQVPTQVR